MIVRRTIDKDELKELPKVVFPGRIHVIQSESETEKAVAYLLSQPILGIDSGKPDLWTVKLANLVSRFGAVFQKSSDVLRCPPSDPA